MFQVESVGRNLRILACELVDRMELAIMLRIAAQHVARGCDIEVVRKLLLTVATELTGTDLADRLQEQIGTLFNGSNEFTAYENFLYPNNKRGCNV